jgi:hypothetical protein
MQWALKKAHKAKSTLEIVQIAVELLERLNALKPVAPPREEGEKDGPPNGGGGDDGGDPGDDDTGGKPDDDGGDPGDEGPGDKPDEGGDKGDTGDDTADDDDPTTPKRLFRVPGTYTLCVAHSISQIKLFNEEVVPLISKLHRHSPRDNDFSTIHFLS